MRDSIERNRMRRASMNCLVHSTPLRNPLANVPLFTNRGTNRRGSMRRNDLANGLRKGVVALEVSECRDATR
jgi:hypothetical protein